MTDEVFMGFGRPDTAMQALKRPDQVEKASQVIADHFKALSGNEPRFRRNFLQRLGEVDKSLLHGGNQIVDVAYFSTKAIGGLKSVKLFTTDEVIKTGTTNLQNGKVETNKPFCMGAVQVTYGVHGTSGGTDPANIDFGAIDKSVRNGYITIKANGRTVVEKASMELFRTPSNEVVGLYYLSNPKMVQPNMQLECEIEWGAAAPADSFIKATLWGAGLEKA